MNKSIMSRGLDFAISNHVPVIILILVLGLFGNAKAEPIYMPYVPEKPPTPVAPLAPQKPILTAEVRKVEPEYQRPASVHEVALQAASIDTNIEEQKSWPWILLAFFVLVCIYCFVSRELSNDEIVR